MAWLAGLETSRAVLTSWIFLLRVGTVDKRSSARLTPAKSPGSEGKGQAWDRGHSLLCPWPKEDRAVHVVTWPLGGHQVSKPQLVEASQGDPQHSGPF